MLAGLLLSGDIEDNPLFAFSNILRPPAVLHSWLLSQITPTSCYYPQVSYLYFCTQIPFCLFLIRILWLHLVPTWIIQDNLCLSKPSIYVECQLWLLKVLFNLLFTNNHTCRVPFVILGSNHSFWTLEHGYLWELSFSLPQWPSHEVLTGHLSEHISRTEPLYLRNRKMCLGTQSGDRLSKFKALLLISCMTLGKSLNCCVPQFFLIFKMEIIIAIP